MSPARLLTAVALVALAAVAPAAAAPSAGSPTQAAQHFATCPDLVLETTIGDYTFGMCFENVFAPSGRAHAHFHGRLLPGVTAPARAVTEKGFLCLVAFPFSDAIASDTRVVITPDGRVNGTCRL